MAQPSSPGPDAVVVRRAEYETVVTALTLLSDKDREVILLRGYEDLPIAQIAVALGCNPEAAKKRLSRALDRLRKATGVIDTAPPTARPVRSNNGGDR